MALSRVIAGWLVVIVAVVAVPSVAWAEQGWEPAFSADNPGFTNVTRAASRLELVTEQAVGASFTDGGETLVLPALLARLGLGGGLELRAFLPSAVVQLPDGGEARVDVDQLAVGGLSAFELADDLGASLSPVVVIPVGDDGVGAQGVESTLQANLSWAISGMVGLDLGLVGGVVQLDRPDGLRARGYFRGGALLGLSPSPATSLYAESYVDCVAGERCHPTVGGGGALWLAPRAQVHLALSSGLGDGAADPAVTLGSAVGW